MPIVTIYHPSYCHGDQVARKVADEQGYPLLNDQDLLSKTADHFGISIGKLERAIYGSSSLFDRVKHDRYRRITYLRYCLADLVKDGHVVYHGFAGHLLTRNLIHVLKVCLVAPFQYRKEQAQQTEKLSEKEAVKTIQKEDQAHKQWTSHLFELGPWDKHLYDIIIPMDSTQVDQAVKEIRDNAAKPPLQTTPAAKSAMADFVLACNANLALVEAGHQIEVESKGGDVTLVINHFVMRLESYQNEITKLVSSLPGVKTVKTKVGPQYHQPNIYPKLDLPKKILLVDDEKEFVHTLSERLQTRNFEPAVAYDGEQALSMVKTDTPDVMVLDLKMPGIDGLEVLRRVKREQRHTEVIILTGHGSQQEKQLAEELGAFAYLNKPVDIDVLSDTMKKAYAKVAETKKDGSSENGNGS